MKRGGKASTGRTRWRRTSYGASSVRRIDNAAKLSDAFLGWLLTGRRKADMPGGGRAVRWRASRFWAILPISPMVEEPRGVIYVDGMHLGRGPSF